LLKRLLAVALLAVVVCVPGVTRASQHLTLHWLAAQQVPAVFTRSNGQAASHERSAPAILDHVAPLTGQDSQPAAFVAPPDRRPIPSPFDAAPKTLRAPPTSA